MRARLAQRAAAALTGLVAAGLLLAACTQGLQLQDGARTSREVRTVAFLFSDGAPEVSVTPAAAAAAAPASPLTALGPPTSAPTGGRATRRVTAPSLTPAAVAAPVQSAPSPPATGAAATGTTPQPEPTATPGTPIPQIDTAVIAANPVAGQIAVPPGEVDPGLELFGESSDPGPVLSPELLAAASLRSFMITGSQRQPEPGSGADLVRPVQFVQRIFVHEDMATAGSFYTLLREQAVPNFATSALDFFRNFYPDLEASARTTVQFAVADENELTEIRIDPQIPPDQRRLGPQDPHVYYIVLRQGLVTAVLEFFYLAPQDPATVAINAERLVKRIPDELRSAT